MQIDWSPLRTELAHWRSAGLTLPVWWRDDDAITPTPALDRLRGLAERIGLVVHLAVIPKHAAPALAEWCRDVPVIVPVVHGWSHDSHAPEGQKKAEFGHPRAGLEEDAQAGLARMQALFGAQILPLFVPPWNRVAPALIHELAGMGYTGLSTFTPRQSRFAAAGLVQINTHIDPINWRGDRSVVPPATLVQRTVQMLKDRREGAADNSEPLGFLTHHLVHDPAIWAVSESLLQELLEGGAKPVNLQSLKDNLP